MERCYYKWKERTFGRGLLGSFNGRRQKLFCRQLERQKKRQSIFTQSFHS